MDRRAASRYDCPVTAEIIDGKAIAKQVRTEVAERARLLRENSDVTPGLALVLAGDSASSLSYVRSKGTTAEEAGLFSEMIHLPQDTPEDEIIAAFTRVRGDLSRLGALFVTPSGKRIEKMTGMITPWDVLAR